MSPSDENAPVPPETQKPDTSDRIDAALRHAKARQKWRFVVGGIFVAVVALATVFGVALSSGTVIVVDPADARQDAKVTVVDAFGFASGQTIYALTSTPTVEVTSPGFAPLRRTLASAETGGTVTVVLAELPGILKLSTELPSDATRWFVDDRLIATGAAVEQVLMAGAYAVMVDNPYHEKQVIDVIIERAKTVERTLTLIPVQGRMSLKSYPRGAQLSVDGAVVGEAPQTVDTTGGVHRVEVSRPDYQTITDDIEITNAEPTAERNYRLILKDATLTVTVSPPGGTLLLNGKKVAPGSLSVKARLNNRLTYLKDGYFRDDKTVTLAPGQSATVDFALAPELGAVDVQSTPVAEISVDGVPSGPTPQVLKLNAVDHTIALTKPGYRGFEKKVRPSAKRPVKIHVTLQNETQAKISESPPTYTNAAGIAFTLFRPNDTYIMGAPRYEKGQRANEFLRTVRLTRPFYAASHEVTEAQYARFTPGGGASDRPVTSVSWNDAARFCNWLSGHEGLPLFYRERDGMIVGFNANATGYRLLTEAEWEWLARKAGKPKQTRFGWGDETTIPPKSGNIADELARGQAAQYVPNYNDGQAGLARVGTYPAEPSGLFDLTGNASEWVHDVYSLIPPDPKREDKDPVGDAAGVSHVIKGSNWLSGSVSELRSSWREGGAAGTPTTGLRIGRYILGGANAR